MAIVLAMGVGLGAITFVAANPLNVAFVQTGGQPVDVELVGDLAYVTGNQASLTAVDISDYELVDTYPIPGLTQRLAYNPSTAKAYVVTLQTDDAVAVFDTVTQSYLSHVDTECGAGAGSGIAVNPQSNTIYANDCLRMVMIDGNTDIVIATSLPTQGPIALNLGTNSVYAIRGSNQNLVELDGTSLALLRELQPPLGPEGARDLALDTILGRVYVLAGEKLVAVDLQSLTVEASLTLGVAPRGVAVDEASHRVYVSNDLDGSLSVVDGVTLSVVTTISVGNNLWYLTTGIDSQVYVSDHSGPGLRIVADPKAVGGMAEAPELVSRGHLNAGSFVVLVGSLALGFVVSLLAALVWQRGRARSR